MQWFEEVFGMLIAAFFGTFAAFASERVLRRRDAVLLEVQALNNLIVDLHLRRALAPFTPVEVPYDFDDREYVGRAVFEIRSQLRDTRLKLRPRSADAFKAIVDMSAACNEYLENTERDRSNYQFYLQALRGTFTSAIARLGEAKKVVYREPGCSAFSSAGVGGARSGAENAAEA